LQGTPAGATLAVPRPGRGGGSCPLGSQPEAQLNAAELASFYESYVDAWNRRDFESYYSLYAADLVFRDGSAVLHGLDALRDRYEAELREWPDLVIECVRLFVDVESQAIAAENIERGASIELRGALFLTLDPKGRISEIAEYLMPGSG